MKYAPFALLGLSLLLLGCLGQQSPEATPAPQPGAPTVAAAGLTATPLPTANDTVPAEVSATPAPQPPPVVVDAPWKDDPPATPDCTEGQDRRRQCQGKTLFHQVCRSGTWKIETVDNSPDC